MTDPRTRTVLVVGGGTAGNAVTVLLRRAGITVDLDRGQARLERSAGSGITLQGNALRVLRELGVWDEVRSSGYAFDSVGLATPDGTRAPRPARTSAPAARTCPPPSACSGPGSSEILVDAVRGSGADGPPRHHRRRAWPRTTTASPSASATAPRAATTWSSRADGLQLRDPRDDRHRRQARADRHGHLARRGTPPGGRGTHRPGLRRALLHRRLLPHQREHHLRLSRRGQPRPRLASTPASYADEMRRLARAVRRRLARDRREHHRPGEGQLHLVRPAAGRGFLAPRPGRAGRRRRPLLPAHPRAGRGHVPGGRLRTGRAADRAGRRPSGPRRPADRATTSAASTVSARSSRPPCSSASGSSTASATPTCPA